MEKLKIRYKTTNQALHSLDTILKTFININNQSSEYAIYRDSVIKRFEYCYELIWKFLKAYLEIKHGVEVPGSPRAIIKQSFELSVIEKPEYEALLKAIEDKNETSHAYHAELAEEIAKHVINYYKVMKQIMDRLSL